MPFAPCLHLQLASIGCPNEESYRRDLREMLFTAPGIENYISGVVRPAAGCRVLRFCGLPSRCLLISVGLRGFSRLEFLAFAHSLSGMAGLLPCWALQIVRGLSADCPQIVSEEGLMSALACL